MRRGVAGAFGDLPSLITQSLGNVNTRVLEQLKSGLPTVVRGLLPFGNGGVVYRPTVGLIGEAGKEVVLPLTRPQRARQLAAESGLYDVLDGAGKGLKPHGRTPAGTVINQNVTIDEVGNARATAHRLAIAVGHWRWAAPAACSAFQKAYSRALPVHQRHCPQ